MWHRLCLRQGNHLRQRGFTFVGPTIVYAFMQACGLVNDHLLDCPQHHECRQLGQ